MRHERRGFAVVAVAETSSQVRVPGEQGVTRGAQPRCVDRPVQVDEQPLHVHLGVTVERGVVEQSHLHRGQRPVVLPVVLVVAVVPLLTPVRWRLLTRRGRASNRGQCGGSPVLEHLFRADQQSGCPSRAHQAERHDAVPTEVEEPVIDTDRRQGQGLGEQPAQQLLTWCPWRAARHQPLPVRGWQGGAVQFAVAGQRQFVQRDNGGRDQRRGQPGGEKGTQLSRIGPANHVAHQTALSRLVLPNQHHRALNLLVPGEHGLDLTRLDPDASDLDLVIGSAEELQISRTAPAHHVAGSVHPRSGLAEGIGHEPFGCQVRPVQVAARQSGAGHVQLPRHPDRYRPQRGVEHPATHAADGPADRDGRVRVERSAQRDRHGRLGRPVAVHHAPPGQRPPGNGVPVQHLPTDEQPTQCGQLDVGHGREHARCGGDMGDRPVGECGGERRAEHPGSFGQHQGGARAQRGQQVRDRRVEGGRNRLQHPAFRIDAQRVAMRFHQCGQPGVCHHHPLGAPGRA